METGFFPTRVLEDVGQIRLRTNQEGWVPYHHFPEILDVSAPGMASASLLRIFPSAKRSQCRCGFDRCDCSAPTRVQQPYCPTSGAMVKYPILILVLQAELARRPAPSTWVDVHHTRVVS